MILIFSPDEAKVLKFESEVYQVGIMSVTQRHCFDHKRGQEPILKFELVNWRAHRLQPLNADGIRARELAKAKGFEDANSLSMNVTRVALMHQELSELLEELRRPQPRQSEKIPAFTAEAEEAADVYLRLVQYCAIRGIDLDAAVAAKHEYNRSRPFKHGKTF